MHKDIKIFLRYFLCFSLVLVPMIWFQSEITHKPFWPWLLRSELFLALFFASPFLLISLIEQIVGWFKSDKT